MTKLYKIKPLEWDHFFEDSKDYYAKGCKSVYRILEENDGYVSLYGASYLNSEPKPFDEVMKITNEHHEKEYSEYLEEVGQGQGWQPIETAPKDGTKILGYCVHEDAVLFDEETGLLTPYGFYSENFRSVENGIHIVEFGGEFVEGDIVVPASWFVYNTDYEAAAFPTHWIPLPETPRKDEK